MRFTRTCWVGVTLIVLGVVPLICWTVWFRTRSWCPVSIPISVTQGSHFTTGEFPVNLSGRYAIEIDTERTPGLDISRCAPVTPDCRPPMLNVEWALSGNEETVHGTAKETGYGPSTRDSLTWDVGIFEAQKGRHYLVQGEVVAAVSAFKEGRPRLNVSVFDTSLETGLVVSGLLRFVSIILALIGGVLLIFSLVRQRRQKVSAEAL